MAQTLTANQIYNLVQPKNLSFAQWIEGEKAEYTGKINAGKIVGQMPFIHWLNQKWQMKMRAAQSSADGTIIGGIADIITKTGEKLGGTSDNTGIGGGYMPPVKPDTILGMKKGVFYTILIVTVSVAGFATYKYIQNRKKSK